MQIRYVIARPELPKEPRRTTKGLSTAKAQDTTGALMYVAAMEEIAELTARRNDVVWAADNSPESKAAAKAVAKAEDALAKAAEAFDATISHLQERDLEAWAVRLDIFSGAERQLAALRDASAITGAMKATGDRPARNPWACDRCDWAPLCEGDPTADNVANWYGLGRAKPPSPLWIEPTCGGSMRKMKRSGRHGAVVSPSEMRTFSSCPRRWRLEYVERLRPTDRDWARMGARIKGVITHAFFEAILRAWTPGDTFALSWTMEGPEGHARAVVDQYYTADVMSAVDRCVADLHPDDWEGREELRAVIPACAKAAYDAAALALEGATEVIAVEEARALKLDGVNRWVFGTADAVIRLGDRLALVELKTTSSKQLATMAEKYRNNPAVDLYAAMLTMGRKARKG